MATGLRAALEASHLPAEGGAPERVRALLAEALRLGASDIHVEPTAEGVRVRLRKDGVLHEAAAWPREWHAEVVARLKVLASLLTYRTDIPQEGRIPSEHAGGNVDLRLSTFPTIFGEKAVVRIFDPRRATFELKNLGFADPVREELERWATLPSGVLIVTGPTGCGKTTTIYALLHRLVRWSEGTKNVVTVEDPVEFAIPGVTQTQINPHAGLTFAAALRSLLRQDPNVVMVGEIRDLETARITVQAGMAGHLVVTTLHAGRASGAFARLLNLGIEPVELSSSVAGVLAQRLLRARCAACAAKGCDACEGTGYTARFPVAETLRPAAAMREAVLARRDVDALERAARQDGLRPIAESAADAVRAGRTTAAEVERVLGPRES